MRGAMLGTSSKDAEAHKGSCGWPFLGRLEDLLEEKTSALDCKERLASEAGTVRATFRDTWLGKATCIRNTVSGD
jgi:hypothetical protein